jgi:hypothetical protein
MATESFYEDLVIDTPEAAAAFTAMFEENKTFVSKGPIMKEADEETIRKFVESLGFVED